MRLIFIFGVFIVLYCNECASKTTVIFLYDKVDTTANDVNFLTNKVTYLSAVFSDKDNGLDLEFKIKFPYGFDVDKIANSTTSRKSESTLKNLLTQIKEAPSYSVIYVITNVTKPSCNDTLLDSILEETQIKRTQVNFLIETDFCLRNDSLQEYGLISSVSDGYAQMGQKLFKYHTFSASYYKRLNTAPQKVCQIEIESIDNYTFCVNNVNMDTFFINARVEELIFGSLDPWGYEMHAGDHYQIEAATRTSEVCTRVYKKLNPGEAQSIRCTYKGENDFDYGFSLQDVRSLNETFRRPMNGTSNKIYVSSSYNKNEFHHFNIIFVNGTSIAQNIPLRPMNESDLFVGSFQPPEKGYFYIQVIRIDNGAKALARISNAISAADGFGANHKNPTFEYRPEYSNVYFNQNPKQSSCGCGCNSKPSLSKAEDSGLSIVYLFIAVAVLATLVVGVSLYLYLTPLYNRLNSLFSRLSD